MLGFSVHIVGIRVYTVLDRERLKGCKYLDDIFLRLCHDIPKEELQNRYLYSSCRSKYGKKLEFHFTFLQLANFCLSSLTIVRKSSQRLGKKVVSVLE